MPKELQLHTAVPTWDSMSPGEKMAWLLDRALDVKRDILTMPLPLPGDDSPGAHRLRSLILGAADSTIEQTIHLQTSRLAPSAADDIAEIIEERRLAGQALIERIRGKSPKPN